MSERGDSIDAHTSTRVIGASGAFRVVTGDSPRPATAEDAEPHQPLFVVVRGDNPYSQAEFRRTINVGGRGVVVEQARTGDLVLHETFRAAPGSIFSRMTDPAELVKWWGPDGFSTPEAVIDLTVGGGYRLTMQPPDGSPFHLTGAFLEVDRPNRLSYTFRWEEPLPDDRETVVVLVLHPVEGGTVVDLSHSGFTTEERVLLHRDGWTQAFEKLRRLVEPTAP